MEQKPCKHVVIPEPYKRPQNPFCSESGLALEKNGKDAFFICPAECKMLLEVQKTSGKRLKDGNSSNLPR